MICRRRRKKYKLSADDLLDQWPDFRADALCFRGLKRVVQQVRLHHGSSETASSDFDTHTSDHGDRRVDSETEHWSNEAYQSFCEEEVELAHHVRAVEDHMENVAAGLNVAADLNACFGSGCAAGPTLTRELGHGMGKIRADLGARLGQHVCVGTGRWYPSRWEVNGFDCVAEEGCLAPLPTAGRRDADRQTEVT